MTTARRVKAFFSDVEEVWGAFPGPVKVFMYSTASYLFAEWVTGSLDMRTVIIAVATNIGIYQIPRTVGSTTKKLL